MPAQVKFVLHNERDEYADIELKYLCLDGKYYRASMRERIKVTNWDPGKQRMKPGAKNASTINEMLDQLERAVYDAARLLTGKNIRTSKEALKTQLRGEEKSFWQFFEWLLKNPPPDWGQHALKAYKKQIGILRRFEKKFGEITFDRIDQRFADELTNFMRTESYGVEKKTQEKLYYNDSTIESTFARISGLTSYAVKYKAIKKKETITTPARGIDAGAVYLSEDEIRTLYHTANHLPKETASRQEINKYSDLFVLGTQIGSRIGYLDIGPENKLEKDGKLYLDLSTNKNPIPVIIPLSSLAIEILEKYKWRIKNVNDVLMNRHIKTISMMSGFTGTIIHRAIEGGKLVERKYNKWELISSHTMRRSFATNFLLTVIKSRGASAATAIIPMLMKITGHKTIESFMRYIRLGNMEAAEIMGEFLS